MAPELLSVDENSSAAGAPTTQSDVFALGMVAIEVITSLSSDIHKLTYLGVYWPSPVPRKYISWGDNEDNEW